MKPAVLLPCAGLLLAASAQAETTAHPWFVGIAAAHAELDFFVEDEDRALQLYGGRRFGEYLFLQAGWNDLGTYAYRNVPSTGGPTSLRLRSIGVAIGARLPIARSGWSVALLAGLHDWEGDFRVQLPTGTTTFGRSSGGTDAWQQLSLAYALSEHWSLSLQHARFRFEAYNATLRQTGLGVEYSF